jgi:hypothetical protein
MAYFNLKGRSVMNTGMFYGQKLVLLLLVLVAGPATAAPVDFTGAWPVIAYGDSDFSNGVVLQPYNLSVNINLSSDPTRDLDMNVLDTNTGGTMYASLDILSDSLASIPERDVIWPGSWTEFPPNLLDTGVLSNGNGMAMGVVGREPTDREQTGFFYSLWEKTPVTGITRNDFLGTWVTSQWFSDPNLRSWQEGFNFESYSTGTITAGTDLDTIIIDLNSPGVNPMELQVAGNRAFLTAPFNTFLAFDLLHDGENLFIASVGQEYDDPTDISLGLGFASPVPLPAAVWLMMGGMGLLGAMGYRKHNPGERK